MRTTFMAKPDEIERKWVLIDATDISLGRLASVVATVLRGKNKPTYTPHTDVGDNVIVINAGKLKLTGRKATDKIYYHHSQHPGGLKHEVAGDLLKDNPTRLVEYAIKKMLPTKNTLGHQQFLKLHVYAGEEHPHTAQKPEVLDITNLI